MNSVNGYHFNWELKVEQKKPEEKGQSDKAEENAIVKPEVNPEPIVLTGNALEMSAILNQAIVEGAGPAKGTANVKDDPTDWEQIWNEYQQMKEAYESNKDNMDYQSKINALNAMQDKLEEILDCPGMPPSWMEQQANTEYASLMQDKVTEMNNYYDENQASMSDNEKEALLEQLEEDIGNMSKYKDTIGYQDKIDALDSIQSLLENILGDEPNNSDIWNQAHNDYAEVIQDKYDAMMENYENNQANMDIQDKIEMLQDIEAVLDDINKYGNYQENMNAQIDEYLKDKYNEIFDNEFDAIQDALNHNSTLSELNGYINDIQNDIQQFIENYGSSMSQQTLDLTMHKYTDFEAIESQLAMQHVYNPPGNSSYDNAVNLLNGLAYINPNYEFIFNNQGEIQNYNYFTQQVEQNEAILAALIHYRDVLSQGVAQTSGRGNSAPPNIVAELNHEIERFEGLLSQARYYMNNSLQTVGIGYAHVPAEQ